MAITREKVMQFTGREDVLCLHALAQPLVSEMQAAIRFQRRQMDHAADAIEYMLRRIANNPKLLDQAGVGTESYARLTASLADLTGDDVDGVRDAIIFGSAEIHRPRQVA